MNIVGDVKSAMDKSPRTVEEKEIGHKCADALAVKLVDQLRGMGYPVLRETEVMGTRATC